MTTPRISVILPVYNAAPFIAEAIDSILSQTFSDFEIIAIDDGSTDASAEIIEKIAAKDRRLRLITRENRGLVATLNEAIDLARGEFLARMDADDISLPTRFAQQVQFLENTPSVAVVGTWTQTFGANHLIWKHPADPAAVESALIFRCPLAHPSVMMRRSLFSRDHFAYDPAARHVEDYALWMAISARFQLANIPEILLRYRAHKHQVSAREQDYQARASVDLQMAFLRHRIQLAISDAESAVHFRLAYSTFDHHPDFIPAADAWLRKLAAANEQHCVFPHEAFLRTLTGRFVWLARAAITSRKFPPPNIDSSPFAPFIRPDAFAGMP